MTRRSRCSRKPRPWCRRPRRRLSSRSRLQLTPAPVPVRAESPPPATAATTDRVLRGVAVLSIVGAVLLAIGVRFPWDFRGRSWLDLKFGTPASTSPASSRGSPRWPSSSERWQRSRSRSVPGRASWRRAPDRLWRRRRGQVPRPAGPGAHYRQRNQGGECCRLHRSRSGRRAPRRGRRPAGASQPDVGRTGRSSRHPCARAPRWLPQC